MTNRPQALAVLITVFLLGCVLGATGTYYWYKRIPPSEIRPVENVRPPMPERYNWRTLLNLTPDQDKRIREIMMESRQRFEELRKEQAPKIEALQKEQAPKIEAFWADTNRKISAILNEEQRKKFNEIVNDMEKRIRSPRGRGFEFPPSNRDRRRSSFEESPPKKSDGFSGTGGYPREPHP